MLAYALNLQQLKMWAKGEFMQIIATFVLAGLLFSLVGVVWQIMYESVTAMYLSNPNLASNLPTDFDPTQHAIDPFGFSQIFLKEVMIDCEVNMYRVFYAINFYFEFVGKMSTEVLGSDPVGGWYTSIYTSFFRYLTGHLNMLMLLHWVQIRFLSVIKYTMPLMIQIGLLLRVFPMSRGAGGLMIAIGFGFFAVYPISLALLTTLQPAGSSFCTEFEVPPLLDVENKGLMTLSPADLAKSEDNLKASEYEVSRLIEKAKNFLPLFYVQAMFLPLVSFIITFTFIRQTGALFGADLNEIGRGLIKLI